MLPEVARMQLGLPALTGGHAGFNLVPVLPIFTCLVLCSAFHGLGWLSNKMELCGFGLMYYLLTLVVIVTCHESSKTSPVSPRPR